MCGIAGRRALALLLGLALAGSVGCVRESPRGGLRQPTARDVAGLRYDMVESLVAQGSYDAAVPLLNALLTQHPRAARLHLLRGIVLREKRVLPAAESELRLAVALDGSDPDAHAALGAVLMRQRRYREAERSHRQACALAPRTAAYHNDLGFCLLVQRRLPAAREALLQAVRLDATLRRAFNNLGLTLGLMGRMEEARDAFAQAGSRALALTNMGYVEELRGRPLAARRYYEQALRQERSYAPALRNLRALEPGRRIGEPAADVIPLATDEEVGDVEAPEAIVDPGDGPAAARSAAGAAGAPAAGSGERVLQGRAPR
ncbi:MAG: tetratricopeptide repeat protein [Proteobacteria bacterium]|nr:tetratricopeptide repeat protein [Pseudomonadota bacterium]